MFRDKLTHKLTRALSNADRTKSVFHVFIWSVDHLNLVINGFLRTKCHTFTFINVIEAGLLKDKDISLGHIDA